MSAHDWIIAARRWLANKLYEPFAVTAWEPSRATTALLPAPAQPQMTGSYALPSIIDGVAGGQPWPGAAGTWRAVYLHQEPHRRRDTGILVPPVQNTGPMQRLHSARLTPIPETPAEIVIASTDRQISDAIARVDSARLYAEHAWLYDDPPVLAPLDSQALASTDRTAVSVPTTEKPTSAMVELAELAARFVDLDDTVEVKACDRKQMAKMQAQRKESE